MSSFDKEKFIKSLSDDMPADLKEMIIETVKTYNPSKTNATINKYEFLSRVYRELPKEQYKSLNKEEYLKIVIKYVPDKYKQLVTNLIKNYNTNGRWIVIEITDIVWQIINNNQPFEVQRVMNEVPATMQVKDDKKINAIIDLLVAKYARNFCTKLWDNRLHEFVGFSLPDDKATVKMFYDALTLDLPFNSPELEPRVELANPTIERKRKGGSIPIPGGRPYTLSFFMDIITNELASLRYWDKEKYYTDYAKKKYSLEMAKAAESENWKPTIKLFCEDFRKLLHELHDDNVFTLNLYNWTFDEYIDLVSDQFHRDAMTLLKESVGQPDYTSIYHDLNDVIKTVYHYPQSEEEIPALFEKFFGGDKERFEKVKIDHKQAEQYFDNLYKTGELQKQTKEYLMGCDNIDDFLDRYENFQELRKAQKVLAEKYKTQLEHKIGGRGKAKSIKLNEALEKMQKKIETFDNGTISGVSNIIEAYREEMKNM